MFVHDIIDAIGDTPLIEITHLDDTGMAKIFAKAEFLNPGGSVKDRIALNMIDQAQKRGEINKSNTLIEATSGNTGIGLAMVCAVRGLDLILTMPESMSMERHKLLKHLGAQIVLTPASEGMTGSVKRAEELAGEINGSFLVRQFANPDNPQAHYDTTSKEILEQMDVEIDIFATGVGTGGTITGIGKRLKEVNPNVRIIAVEPANSAVLSGEKAGIHGIQGIGAGFIPEILEMDLVDEIIVVSDEEAVYHAEQAANNGGLLIGISSGANLAAAHKIANKEENRGKTIVTILPDTAERYMSTSLFH